MVNGSATSGDINMITGKIWLRIASLRSALHIERVESAANVADGPTREFFVHLKTLGATEVEPRMPKWIESLWAPLVSLVL